MSNFRILKFMKKTSAQILPIFLMKENFEW